MTVFSRKSHDGVGGGIGKGQRGRVHVFWFSGGRQGEQGSCLQAGFSLGVVRAVPPRRIRLLATKGDFGLLEPDAAAGEPTWMLAPRSRRAAPSGRARA